ncbi:MAG: NAD-dependent epimerase/dehydratase family protein [Shimia sp.]
MSVAVDPVAVTGASGFIGRYLCAALEAEGRDVIRIGRTVGDSIGGGQRQTDYSQESLMAALEGARTLVHLAGRRMTREDAPLDLAPFWAPNVAVIAPLVTAARACGVERIVLASTIAVYGPGSGLPYREDAPAQPINAYALSKLMAEQYLEMMTRRDGPSAAALRFAAVYGAGEKGTPALMKFIGQARAAETIQLQGHGAYVIDQLYIRDAVDALRAAMASTEEGSFNIGGGHPWSIREIAEAANATFGNDGNLTLEVAEGPPGPATVMDISRARTALNWAPRHDLRAGMADFAQTLHQGEPQ